MGQQSNTNCMKKFLLQINVHKHEKQRQLENVSRKSFINLKHVIHIIPYLLLECAVLKIDPIQVFQIYQGKPFYFLFPETIKNQKKRI